MLRKLMGWMGCVAVIIAAGLLQSRWTGAQGGTVFATNTPRGMTAATSEATLTPLEAAVLRVPEVESVDIVQQRGATVQVEVTVVEGGNHLPVAEAMLDSIWQVVDLIDQFTALVDDDGLVVYYRWTRGQNGWQIAPYSASALATVTVTTPPPATLLPTLTPVLPTPEPTTAVSLETMIASMEGIESVDMLSVIDRFVYIEARVIPGYNTQAFAASLLAATEMSTGTLDGFSIIMNDGQRGVDYQWFSREWRTTDLSSLMQPAPLQPTRAPQPTVAFVPPPPQGQQRPRNCATAVAMGLSAVEAAQWNHLDRDNDGVACYGD